jgi:hypothetical protein
MTIKRDTGDVYSVRYYDDMATACFDPYVEGPPALALGGAIINANVMHSNMQAWCLNDPAHPEYGPTRYLGPFGGDTIYDASTDTFSSMGVTWYRGN